MYIKLLFMKMLNVVLTLLLAALFFHPASAQFEKDNSESPYFLVKGKDKHVSMPLISSTARINISGVIANVEVEQVYTNKGKKPIEAEYVFPGSSRSAVYGMTMWVGERKIEAKIKEKQAARELYNKAKSEGKTASLLQQHRPNVFQMNVANILPGDKIRVILRYNEILVPEEGVYEFVYPTVVGPRYADSAGVEKDPWVVNPFANPHVAKELGVSANTKFDLSMNLLSSIPIKEANSPTHPVKIQFTGKNQATVQLNGVKDAGRDFIFRYRLAGNAIETGLSVYDAGDEKFFMLMVQPPQRILPDQIPPREYIFILDVSGSMNGFPIELSKKLMRNLFANLRPGDKFNVLLFAGSSSVFAPSSVPATEENLDDAQNFIDKENGNGSTELLPALKEALSLPEAEGFSRSLVIVTDGYVTVETEAFDLVRENLGKANFFAFGIGESVNRHIIEGLAHCGNGEPLVVTGQQDAEEKAEKFRKYIQTPVLSNIKYSFNGIQVSEAEPEKTGDLFAEKPLVLIGKYTGEANGTLTIEGLTGKGIFKQNFPMNAVSQNANAPLRHLWARHKIMRLSDYANLAETEERKKEIVALGLKYNLLTKYTSFVGVDETVRVDEKDLVSNSVSNSAASPGAVPEPHEWAIIIVSVLVMLYFILPLIRIRFSKNG
jgi:Ca-activated chloride channel homolog